MVINYQQHVGPVVAAKCASCHTPTVPGIDSTAAGGLDLTAVPDTTMENRVFPRGYINLSGESMSMASNVVTPGFPRRSRLIDRVLGLGAGASGGPHPAGANALTPEEKRMLNLWVLLGAQYK
jgi:hypothetical protein